MIKRREELCYESRLKGLSQETTLVLELSQIRYSLVVILELNGVSEV